MYVEMLQSVCDPSKYVNSSVLLRQKNNRPFHGGLCIHR